MYDLGGRHGPGLSLATALSMITQHSRVLVVVMRVLVSRVCSLDGPAKEIGQMRALVCDLIQPC